MARFKVGYLVGSLATNSINRKLAKALMRLAPERLEFSEISFKDLPLYSYDYDNDYPEVARQYRLPVQEGIIVLQVDPQSPAGRAGIRREDIITDIGGTAITNGGDLRRVLRERRPGETVPITVRRLDGSTRRVNVRLGEAPQI